TTTASPSPGRNQPCIGCSTLPRPATRGKPRRGSIDCDRARTDPKSFGHDYGLQVADRLIQAVAVVDDDVVILAHTLHLALGRGEPPLALFRLLGTARLKTWRELF